MTALTDTSANEAWLRRYYFTRAAFSIAWVAAALALGTKVPAVAAALLVAYPAWDAAANWADAARSGGLAANPTQRLNVWASGLAAVAVAGALAAGLGAVLGVVGAWAIASGLLQLGTAVRRWKTHGAQWAMGLSGAQSALAGGLFIARSFAATPHSIADVAGYAGVGAAYFLVSAVWLTVQALRRAARTAA